MAWGNSRPHTTRLERGLPIGRSLFDIAGEPYDPERSVLSEYHAAGSPSAAYMLRRGRFKYIHYTGFAPELFDLEDDPEELNAFFADATGKQQDPGRRHRDPDQVPAPVGGDQGNPEWPDELEGHGDAERDPVDRLVEGEVHRSQHETEEQGDPGPAPVQTEAWSPDQDQQHRRDQRPEEGYAHRPDLVEETGGERRSDLDRADRPEHHRHRRQRRRGMG